VVGRKPPLYTPSELKLFHIYIYIWEVLLFGHGRNKGVFATNKELPPNPNLSDLSLQNKHKYI
jgi:hypothetical protein